MTVPNEFQHEGLRLNVAVRGSPSRVSFHMWGSIGTLVAIHKA